MLSLFFFLSSLSSAQGGGLCGSLTAPTDPDVLQLASVYQKGDIFRISIDDVTDEGYNVLASSGQALLATKDNLQCLNAQCMFQLYTNQRDTDKNILQQDNWLGGFAPMGYTKLENDVTSIFCVRWLGDCGATVPIYRYFIFVGINGWSHAYSIGTEVDYAGYTKEPFPICYGWPSTSTTTASNEGIAADKLVTLSTYVNNLTGANRDHWTTIWTPSINESAFDGYTWAKDVTRVASSLSASTDTLQCNSLVKVIQMYDKQVGVSGTEKAPGLFSRFDHKIILESQVNGKEANLPFENYTATGEYFYCVLSQGSCGATVPLKKWFNGFEIDTIYTVTGDDDPLLVRNDGVLCYTWPLDSSSASDTRKERRLH
uniref:Uncharacterized protein n=1 Tax=Plectus sambesii TaxID=2011161 RepID=A0A914XCC6_9BILA